MSSHKAVKKESTHLERFVKKLQEQGIDAQISKRPKILNKMVKKEKTNIWIQHYKKENHPI